MPSFDLNSLRAYAAELDSQPMPPVADAQERVESQVRHHADFLATVLELLATWREQVFRACLSPDVGIDDFFKEWLANGLTLAKRAARLGRGSQRGGLMPPQHRVPDLDRLHELLADATDQLDDWLTAARSVSPGPRARVPDAVTQKMRTHLRALEAAEPALPVTPAVPRVTDPELV